jgi:hypothetical protein
MPKRAHLIAGILAPLCIATFFLSTIFTELFGSHAAVAQLKSLIVTPGLWIMVPLMAAAGGRGMFLARSRRGRLIDAKKKRVPFIAANGLLVLVPCAIVLNRWCARLLRVVRLRTATANALLSVVHWRCAAVDGHDRSLSPHPTSRKPSTVRGADGWWNGAFCEPRVTWVCLDFCSPSAHYRNGRHHRTEETHEHRSCHRRIVRYG